MRTRRSRMAEDDDSPRQKVKLSNFRISATACTNAQYAAFVAASGYRTVAAREGWSYVFHLLLADPPAHDGAE